jgi:S1-C subfamily serine protease
MKFPFTLEQLKTRRFLMGAAIVLLLVVGLSLLHCKSAATDVLKHSVVKIFVVVKRADYNQPWLMTSQYSVSGSGMILPGQRILTNAHVISDQVFVQVLKAGDTKKYTAHVEYVGHDLECALLTVDDPAFFEGTVPVEFGDVPQQRDKVAAFGFPIGGDELSITEGVVSRIEVLSYIHSQRNLLAIQTDAAINPGNSGGPVFMNGKCVGISFQSFKSGGVENTGYIVPVPIIKHFLKDIADKKYDGVPMLGVAWEKMENPSLREKYSLSPNQSGVLATLVVPGSSCDGVIKVGDVLLSVDGVKVANDGSVPFRGQERLEFSYLVTSRQVGEPLKLEVLRAGKVTPLNVTSKPVKDLVPRPQYDTLPTYYVVGGLVFTQLTFNSMVSASGSWGNVPTKFRNLYENGSVSPEHEQIVVLSQVLPHEINVGYHEETNMIVSRVNGQKIRNMSDVVAAFQKPMGDFDVVETDADTDDGFQIVLSADGVRKANDEILKRFQITTDRSADLPSAATASPAVAVAVPAAAPSSAVSTASASTPAAQVASTPAAKPAAASAVKPAVKAESAAKPVAKPTAAVSATPVSTPVHVSDDATGMDK